MNDNVVIEIQPITLGQTSLIDNLTGIANALKLFLSDVIVLGNKEEALCKDGSALVSRSTYQNYCKEKDKNASDSLVSRRLSELIDLGVAVRIKQIQHKKRINHYVISDLSPLAKLPNLQPEKTVRSRRSKTIVAAQKDMFRQAADGILLENPKSITVHFHEQVFNGILDAAMRLSSRDERREIVAECTVAGSPLTITTTCGSNDSSAIAILTDQRAMRNIISFCKKDLIRRKALEMSRSGEREFDPRVIPNLFRLDIHDLCKLMSMKTNNQNLDLIVQMMQRLADTKFTVDASKNKWFRDNFSAMPGGFDSQQGSDIFEFRFLQNFEIARENTKMEDLFGVELSELRPRIYTFSLEIRIFYTLLFDNALNLFLSHEELGIERSGIIQRFYNWARAWVSGRVKSRVSETWYTMREMHQHLTPASRYDNFQTYFMRALQKFKCEDVDWEKGGTGKSLVYGYYVFYKREDGEEKFRFERDPMDEIVGDNSRHNVLLRKEVSQSLDYNG